MTRSASDNFNLDLMIAQRFGMTLDQVDALPLGLIEIVREAIWEKEWDCNQMSIVAAPEMLAALEEALEVLGELEPEERWPGLDNVERNWRFVIAKAKGLNQ